MKKLEHFHILDERAWQERIEGWLIVGCSIRKGPVISLVLRRDIEANELSQLSDDEVPTRVFYFNLATNVSGYDQFDYGMRFPKIGSSEFPDSLTICAARSPTGPVWVVNRNYAEMEQVRPDALEKPRSTVAVSRIVQVNGRAYAVSRFRRLFRRDGPNQWILVSEGIPPGKVKSPFDEGKYGFHDLHGLTEDNLYAVGGHGDVWRYDGIRWIQCDFPSNKELDTVTVAPDGQVYISGQSGSLWVGKEDTWTLLANGSSSVPYNDSRWFKGKLWLISDYQLHVLEDGELRRATHSGARLIHTGWMDCTDDLMVIATNGGSVHVFDGADWKTVIRPYS